MGGEDIKPPRDTEHPHYSYKEAASQRLKFYDALVVAAIVALVGAVWVLGRSVAVLQASDGFQNERLGELRSDMRELQGKSFRGVDGYEDAKQPQSK
jgi:hypothetical protein